MVHKLSGIPSKKELELNLVSQLNFLVATHPFYTDFRGWRRLKKGDPGSTYDYLLDTIKVFVEEHRETANSMSVVVPKRDKAARLFYGSEKLEN